MVRPPAEPPGSGVTTGAAVRRALRERAEIGLLDVRPEGLFAGGHPLFAASFPAGRLEAEVLDRLPRRSVPLVVYGDSEQDAAVAAARLRGLGYRDVSVLDGGLAGWAASGGELFRDVNAPSKAFGGPAGGHGGLGGSPQGRGRPDQRWPAPPLLNRGERTVYRFDVRSPAEYAGGHLAGFRSAPGGQLVQETDWFAPVRGALVVLAGDGGGRAAMTASWLAQMGWEVAVLEAGADGSGPATGPWAPAWPPPPEHPLAGPAQVDSWLRDGEAVVVDIDSSRAFRITAIPAGGSSRPGAPSSARSRCPRSAATRFGSTPGSPMTRSPTMRSSASTACT